MNAAEIAQDDADAYASGLADGVANHTPTDDDLTYHRGYNAGRGPRRATYDPAKVRFTFNGIECVPMRTMLPAHTARREERRARRRRKQAAPVSMRVTVNTALIALDPGLLHPAAARFNAGRLVRAARTNVEASWSKLGIAQRQLTIAQAIVDWAKHVEIDHSLEPARHVVFEYPQVYSETKAMGVRPKDLLAILGVAEVTVGILAGRAHLRVYGPTPAEVWGKLPKATEGDPRENPRGARVWSRLDADERRGLELTHDAFDAAGLGLWLLGRFEPVHVCPGAT